MQSQTRVKTLVFYYLTEELKVLSYNEDWADAFSRSEQFQCDFINLATVPMYRILPRLFSYELIVFLHSTNSNQPTVSRTLKQALKWRRGKVAVFVGNEFKLLPFKLQFIRDIQADWVLSQLPQDVAEWLYGDCVGSKVLSLPHALNPNHFMPVVPEASRDIDIGVRAFEYPWYLGDRDRADVLRFFAESPRLSHLVRDISFDPKLRFDRKGWAAFLNHCKGTVSSEAGTSILEKDDSLRERIGKHLKDYPETSYGEIDRTYFKPYLNPISGKATTARHFDAIGTQTCQIMLRGRYNDILEADEHYICLEQDYRNLEDVLERFQDVSYRFRMATRTREFVLDAHCHDHRVRKFYAALEGT